MNSRSPLMGGRFQRFWMRTVLLGVGLACGVFFSQGRAEESPPDSAGEGPPVSYGGELDFNSRYVWHGLAWSEGAVWQPSVWVSAYNFTFSVWNNFVLNDEANQGQFNEVDLNLAYEWEWKKLAVKPALQSWLYPNQPGVPATGQFSLELSYPAGPVRFFTSHAFDIAAYAGAYYADFGVSLERELGEKLSLSSSLGFSIASSQFNDAYVGLKRTTFGAAGGDRGQVALIYHPTEFSYLRPHASYSYLMDHRLRSLVEHPHLFTFGLAAGVEF